MYCKKCGNQLVEGAKFCAKCGNVVSNVENTGTVSMTRPIPQINETMYTQSVPVVQTPPKKKSKWWLFLIPLLLLGMIGGAAFGYFYNDSSNSRESRKKDKEEVKETTGNSTETNNSEGDSNNATSGTATSATSSPTPTPTPTPTAKVYTNEEIKTLVYGNISQFYKNYINAINNQHMDWIDHVTDEVSEKLYKRYKEVNEGYTFTIHKIWIDNDSIAINKESDDKYVVTFEYGADISYYKGGTKQSHPKMHVRMEINPSNNDWIITKSENDNKINTTGHTVIDITNY